MTIRGNIRAREKEKEREKVGDVRTFDTGRKIIGGCNVGKSKLFKDSCTPVVRVKKLSLQEQMAAHAAACLEDGKQIEREREEKEMEKEMKKEREKEREREFECKAGDENLKDVSSHLDIINVLGFDNIDSGGDIGSNSKINKNINNNDIDINNNYVINNNSNSTDNNNNDNNNKINNSNDNNNNDNNKNSNNNNNINRNVNTVHNGEESEGILKSTSSSSQLLNTNMDLSNQPSLISNIMKDTMTSSVFGNENKEGHNDHYHDILVNNVKCMKLMDKDKDGNLISKDSDDLINCYGGIEELD